MTIDEALEAADEHIGHEHHVTVLAAEVRRLRSKLTRVELALATYRGYTLADKVNEALREPLTGT